MDIDYYGPILIISFFFTFIIFIIYLKSRKNAAKSGGIGPAMLETFLSLLLEGLFNSINEKEKESEEKDGFSGGFGGGDSSGGGSSGKW
jgi:uncharacterized membrane protein YgcG